VCLQPQMDGRVLLFADTSVLAKTGKLLSSAAKRLSISKKEDTQRRLAHQLTGLFCLICLVFLLWSNSDADLSIGEVMEADDGCHLFGRHHYFRSVVVEKKKRSVLLVSPACISSSSSCDIRCHHDQTCPPVRSAPDTMTMDRRKFLYERFR
jgi:hypothetical protein